MRTTVPAPPTLHRHAPPRRCRRALPALLLSLALAACGGEAPATSLDADAFVDAIVALRQSATEAGSMDAFQRRRGDVLREVGVTEEELQAYVAAHGRDTGHMHEVWVRIRERLQEDEEMSAEDDLPVEEDAPGPPRAGGREMEVAPDTTPKLLRRRPPPPITLDTLR